MVNLYSKFMQVTILAIPIEVTCNRVDEEPRNHLQQITDNQTPSEHRGKKLGKEETTSR